MFEGACFIRPKLIIFVKKGLKRWNASMPSNTIKCHKSVGQANEPQHRIIQGSQELIEF